MRPYIVVGDATDHGGVVIGSTQTTDTFGKRLARVGDQVTCPKKGHGTTVIVTGDPTMIVDGAPVARHGDKCACGATLISGQVLSGVGEGGAARHERDTQAAPSLFGNPTSSTHQAVDTASHEDFEQCFVMLDAQGCPASGFAYRLDRDGAQVHEAAVDSAGATKAFPASAQLKATFWVDKGATP